MKKPVLVLALATGLALAVARAQDEPEPSKSLGARHDAATGSAPSFVAAGDLDGDGKLDLVVANAKANTVSVLLGKGDGTFAEKKDYPVGKSPGWVVLADLNGDRKLDIVVANRGEPTVSVLLGKGDGTFGAKKDVTIGGKENQPAMLVVADLNGDGKPDIVTANLCQSVMVLGGKPDDPRYWPNGVTALMGDGKGGFTPKKNLLGPATPTFLALADVNGDKRLDLFASAAVRPCVSLYLQTPRGFGGEPEALETGTGPVAFALGDLQGKKTLDLVVANHEDRSLSVLRANGAGGFEKKVDVGTKGYPEAIVLADVDGDGKLDAVVLGGGEPTTVAVHLGKGDGTLGEAKGYDIEGFPTSIAVADVNGDGKLDVIVTLKDLDKVAVFLGDGSLGK
jgi:hypothetical protein